MCRGMVTCDPLEIPPPRAAVASPCADILSVFTTFDLSTLLVQCAGCLLNVRVACSICGLLAHCAVCNMSSPEDLAPGGFKKNFPRASKKKNAPFPFFFFLNVAYLSQRFISFWTMDFAKISIKHWFKLHVSKTYRKWAIFFGGGKVSGWPGPR